MANAWAQPHNPTTHPWFDTPCRKRKSPPGDDHVDITRSREGQAKRRRSSDLEHGFAHLTLNSSSSFQDPRSYPSIVEPAFNTDFSPVTLESASLSNLPPIIRDVTSHFAHSAVTTHPSSIEEPITPSAKMQNWYEVENDRIVVTDLDDADDVAEHESDFVISPVVLGRIKYASSLNSIPVAGASLEDGPCKALVLFRPAVRFDIGSQPDDDEVKDIVPPTNCRSDDDAMDVEP